MNKQNPTNQALLRHAAAIENVCGQLAAKPRASQVAVNPSASCICPMNPATVSPAASCVCVP